MEIWKVISGFEDRYEVSNQGNVRSLARVEYMPWQNANRCFDGKMLRLQKKDNHYIFIALRDGTRYHQKYVHRLVYEAFKGPIPPGFIVNHKDKDRANNNEDNLELVTQRENCLHGLIGRNKSSKYPGVHLYCGRWKAMARVKGTSKKIYLGTFDDETEAYKAYCNYVGELNYLPTIQ